jgi:hypothetical protein
VQLLSSTLEALTVIFLTIPDCFPCLQIMYDISGAGRHLRRYTAVSLALWHNIKWATARICILFGNDFIGPFFHRLFPDHCYDPKKMSHPSLTSILSIMRLSYPSFKEELVKARQTPRLTPRARALLDNLFHMFEMFIPIVSLCLLCFLYACICCRCTLIVEAIS